MSLDMCYIGFSIILDFRFFFFNGILDFSFNFLDYFTWIYTRHSKFC